MKKLFFLLLILSGLSAKAQGVNIGLSQRINTHIELSEERITVDEYTGKKRAYVSFVQLDDNNNLINTYSYTRDGLAFNDFWQNFNSLSYLYSLLNLTDSTGTLIPLPPSLENDILNK